jgi:hypothetical protein
VLDYPNVSANSIVMAAPEAAIQKNTRYFKLCLDGRVKPGHDSGAKIRQCFHDAFRQRKHPGNQVPG